MILSVDNIHESFKAKVKQGFLNLILIGMTCLPIQIEKQRFAGFFPQVFNRTPVYYDFKKSVQLTPFWKALVFVYNV